MMKFFATIYEKSSKKNPNLQKKKKKGFKNINVAMNNC